MNKAQFDMFFLFSLVADGTYTLGVENEQGEQVTTEFEVLPISVEDLTVGTATGSGVAGPDCPLDGFRFQDATGGRFLTFTPTNLGDAFTPYVVATTDGLRFMSQNWEQATSMMPTSLTVYSPSPGEVYLTVYDLDFSPSATHTFDMDVAEATPAVSDVSEVEPNDDPAAPHALGQQQDLDVVRLQGDLTSVGNGGDEFTGDHDLYTFEVESDSYVTAWLDWPDAKSDYDLMLFDVTNGPADTTNWSNQIMSFGATLQNPELVGGVLLSDHDYAALVVGWDGNPGTYELTLAFANAT